MYFVRLNFLIGIDGKKAELPYTMSPGIVIVFYNILWRLFRLRVCYIGNNSFHKIHCCSAMITLKQMMLNRYIRIVTDVTELRRSGQQVIG